MNPGTLTLLHRSSSVVWSTGCVAFHRSPAFFPPWTAQSNQDRWQGIEWQGIKRKVNLFSLALVQLFGVCNRCWKRGLQVLLAHI